MTCDCATCVFDRKEKAEAGFTGWHYITLTHLPHGEAAECRCGWRAVQSKVGAAILQHRQAEGLLA